MRELPKRPLAIEHLDVSGWNELDKPYCNSCNERQESQCYTLDAVNCHGENFVTCICIGCAEALAHFILG